LGVIPLIVLVLIEGQIFYGANIKITTFLIYTTVLVATGLTVVYFYQYTFRMKNTSFALQFIFGLIGLGLLLVGYLIFVASGALTLDAGRWEFVNKVTKLVFSWNVIARYLHFLVTALAVSGAGLVFFTFNWKETSRDLDSDYASYLRKLGGGLALGFALLQPIFIFWNLDTMPTKAFSPGVYSLSVFVLLIVMFICLVLYRLLKNAEVSNGTTVIILFIIAFIGMIVNTHVAQENAIDNQTAILIARAEEVESQVKAEREAKLTTNQEPDVKLGEEIYNNQCSVCHHFDSRVVGPPYNEVLPKFEGKQEELVKFVKNPYKINPDYPPMPNLGLTDHQAQSVIAFLFKHYNEEKQK